MAEMLLYMIDRTGTEAGIDVYHNAKLSQRGDVIVVKPDGWVWGVDELADPFLVVVVPDATVADLESFLSHEMPQPGNDEDRWGETTNTLQYRGFKVDVDSYTGGVLRSGTGVPLAEVMALKVQRPPIQDPAVIGDSRRIIG